MHNIDRTNLQSNYSEYAGEYSGEHAGEYGGEYATEYPVEYAGEYPGNSGKSWKPTANTARRVYLAKLKRWNSRRVADNSERR